DYAYAPPVSLPSRASHEMRRRQNFHPGRALVLNKRSLATMSQASSAPFVSAARTGANQFASSECRDCSGGPVMGVSSTTACPASGAILPKDGGVGAGDSASAHRNGSSPWIRTSLVAAMLSGGMSPGGSPPPHNHSADTR